MSHDEKAAVIIAILGFALRWVQKKVSGQRAAARIAAPQPRGWVWPMPRAADGAPPVISDGWGSPRDKGARRHAGVDVMYRRDVTIPKGGKVPAHESRGFHVPQGTTVLAVAPGKVWSTSHGARGWRIVVDHGTPWSTVYQHVETLLVPEHKRGKRLSQAGSYSEPPTTVDAGTVLGTVGYSTMDASRIRHLHFELHNRATPVDPTATMRDEWDVLG